MSDRAAKRALYAEFAAAGKALGNPARLELLDLLAQGPRHVDDLAAAAGLGVTTCSAHLQALREAALVTNERRGKRIFYSLAGDDVARLWDALRRVALNHRAETDRARRAYLGPEDTEGLTREEMLSRVRAGTAVVVDVRPTVEYAAGHLPGALGIPLEELGDRLAELPDDKEIVAYCRGAYCVFSHEAARLLQRLGRRAGHTHDGVVEWRAAGLPLEANDNGGAQRPAG